MPRAANLNEVTFKTSVGRNGSVQGTAQHRMTFLNDPPNQLNRWFLVSTEGRTNSRSQWGKLRGAKACCGLQADQREEGLQYTPHLQRDGFIALHRDIGCGQPCNHAWVKVSIDQASQSKGNYSKCSPNTRGLVC